MAKVQGPILSMGATGQIGKAMVFGSWRGVPYARQYVQPSNPQSSAQTETRSVFGWATHVWKTAGSLIQEAWDAYAKGQPFTGRNQFIGKNTKAMRGMTDLADFVAAPGSNGGIPPQSFSSTGGSGDIVFALTNPTPPVGWTLSGATVMAIRAQNPQSGALYQEYELAASSPYTAGTISGLAAGTYVTAAWLKWTKPDGSFAYSPSLAHTATVT